MRQGTARLVGRRAEIAAMQAQLDELARGRGGVVLVLGEAGGGKSELLRSVFTAQDREHRVVWTAGDELSQVFPLLPFVEAVDGQRQAEIAALLRGGASVSDPSIAATEELVAWLDDLCAVSPVTLVFDDLHWADTASVRLWNRLTRSAEQLPLLVVGSMRTGQDRADLTAVARRVAGLAAAGRGVLAELAPLSPREATELVSSIVGGTPGARLRKLATAAGGNPLYLTELTSALVRDGALTAVSGTVDANDYYQPASLSSAIQSRLDAMPHDVRDLLRLAALLGVEFDVSVLSIASDRPVYDLVAMLGRAQTAGLLVATDAGMAFRHPLIRDVLCDQVPGSMRAAWHQEVGRALAQAGQSPTAVARQLLAAIDAGGELPASDWLINWLALEGETLTNQSVTVVTTLFKHTLKKLPLTDPHRSAVALPLAMAMQRAYNLDEAERLAEQTLDNAGQLDAHTTMMLGSIIYECRFLRAQPREAHAILDRLEPEAVSDQHRTRLLVWRARACTITNRLDEAEQFATEAAMLARKIGDLVGGAMACHSLFMCEQYRGDLRTGLTHVEHGLALIQDAPASLDVHMSLAADRALALLELGDWEDATVTAAQLRALAERTGNERRHRQSVECDVLRQYLVGDWDNLLAEVDNLDYDDPVWLRCTERAVVALLHRDELEAAQPMMDALERLLPRWAVSPNTPHEYAVFRRALAMEHSGDLVGAFETQLNAVLNLWTIADVPTAHVVNLGMRLGRRADAERVTAFAEEKPYERVREALIAHCHGLLDGDPVLLDEAAARYQTTGLKLAHAQAAESAGLAWIARGDLKTARRAMTESLMTYESLGASWDIGRVRAAFREHGLRTGSRDARNRPVAGWQSLTPTETKIANMVADGLSNRLMAERLFLSRRTVDTHVSHILQKLGMRSRVEVATTALSHRTG